MSASSHRRSLAFAVLFALQLSHTGCRTTDSEPDAQVPDAHVPVGVAVEALTATIWSETFETGVPSGYPSSNLQYLNVSDPSLTPPYKRRFDVVTANGATRLNGNVHAGNWSAQWQAVNGEIIKQVDTRNYPNLSLSYWRKVLGFEGLDRFYVRYSITGSSGPWTNLQTVSTNVGSFTQSTITLPADAANNIIWISFFSDFKTSNGVIDEWVYIDDITLTGGCNSAADCNDGIACNTDLCSGTTGQCSHTVAPNDVTCDGKDDNCSGQNDEGYVSVATSCGVGACARTGMSSCVSGAVQSNCTPGTPAANDATCNSVDEDCSGSADEDFAGQSTTCGIGACARTGTTSCVNGAVQDSCAPGTPAANDTTCNASDDNCNGLVDESCVPSLPTPTNIVQNGTFESGLAPNYGQKLLASDGTPVQAPEIVSLETADTGNGSSGALRVSIVKDPAYSYGDHTGAIIPLNTTVQPGSGTWLDVRFRAKSISGGTLMSVMKLWGGGYDRAELTKSWRTYEVAFPLAASTNALIIALAGDEGVFLIDDIQVFETPSLAVNGHFASDIAPTTGLKVSPSTGNVSAPEIVSYDTNTSNGIGGALHVNLAPQAGFTYDSQNSGAVLPLTSSVPAGSWLRVGFVAKYLRGASLLNVMRSGGGSTSARVRIDPNGNWYQYLVYTQLLQNTSALIFNLVSADNGSSQLVADGELLLDAVNVSIVAGPSQFVRCGDHFNQACEPDCGATGQCPAGVVDTLTAAPLAAYSVAERLRTSYFGPAIRVRRASDQREYSVGFTGQGQLNEAKLAFHCGSSDCYLSKLYDQSGNGRDLDQSGTQIKFYDGGTHNVVARDGALPTLDIRTDAASIYRSDSLGLVGNPAMTVAYAGRYGAAGASGTDVSPIRIGGTGNGVVRGELGLSYQTAKDFVNYGGGHFDWSVPANTVMHTSVFEHAAGASSGASSLLIDGAAASFTTTPPTDDGFHLGATTTLIGKHASDTSGATARLRSAIIWNATLSSADRAKIDGHQNASGGGCAQAQTCVAGDGCCPASCNHASDADCSTSTTGSSCDSSFVPVGTSCGVGACARGGVLSCVSGTVQNSCAPGTPAASDATCDGIDDNCNGTVDENGAAGCSDGIECTTDICSGTGGQCSHAPTADGTVCHDRQLSGGGLGDGVCNGNSQCVLRPPVVPFDHTNTDLAAYWHFDEASGTSASDSTGHGNTGTIANGTWDPNGRSGSCLYFNGTSSVVTVPEGTWNVGTPVTYSVWYKDAGAPVGYILEHGLGGAIVGAFGLQAQWMRFAARDSTNADVGQAALKWPAPGVWSLATVVITPSAIKLYKDGVLLNSSPITGGMPHLTGPLAIGARGTVGDSYFKGWIDEVSVWKRALSDTEVAALYQPTPSKVSTAPGLVAHWTFDEAGGTTAYDSSGQSNHGQLTSATWDLNCRSGSCLYFNGTSSVMSVPQGTWNGGTPATYVVWYKTDGNPTGFVLEHQRNTSPAGSFGFEPASTHFSATASGGANVNAQYTSAPNGEWTMATVVVTSTGVSIYQNGTLLGTTPISGGLPVASGPLYLGARGSAGNSFFKGWIDDASVYNRALSAAEVLDLYKKAGLVGRWSFNEGSGTTASDSSGHGNAGQIANATWDANGRSGSCLYFNGTNSVVTIPDGTWDRGTSATYVLWTKSDGTPTGAALEHQFSANRPGTFIYYPSDTYFGAYYSNSGSVSNLFGAISANTWVMVAIVVSPTDVKVYKDGVLAGTLSLPGSIPYWPGPLDIGSRDSTDHYFKGWIDEVSVYDGALSATGISELYKMGNPLGALFVLKPETVSPQTHGASAVTWSDANGGNVVFTGAGGGNAPMVVTGLEGKLLVVFGGDDYMTASLGDTSSWSGITIVAALQTSGAISQRGALLGSGGPPGSQHPTSGIQWAAGVGTDAAGGLGWAGSDGTTNLGRGRLDSNTNYVFSWKRGRAAGSGWTVRRNGTPQATSPIPDSSFPTGTFNAYLGAAGLTAQVLSGGIFALYELHVYPRELSDAETTLVEQELAKTYEVGWYEGGSSADPSVTLNGDLFAWYDASQLSASDGTPISNWPNRTSNAPFAASGSSQPLYNAHGINGHPSVVGDGINDFALANFQPALPVGSRPHIWLVMRQFTPMQYVQYMMFGQGNSQFVSLGSNGSNWLTILQGGAGMSIVGSSWKFDTSAHIISSGLSADFQQHLKFDDVPMPGNIDPGATTIPISDFSLFADYNKGTNQTSNYSNMAVGEVIVSRTTPSAATDDAIQHYLAAKWAPPVGCSSSYPCASGPGACTTNADCQSGLTCNSGIGSRYGYAPGLGACWDPNAPIVKLTPATIGPNATTWSDANGGPVVFNAGAGSYKPLLVTGPSGQPGVMFQGAQYMQSSLGDTAGWNGMTVVAALRMGPSVQPVEAVLGSGGAPGTQTSTTGARWVAGVGSDATRGLGWAGSDGATNLGSGAGFDPNSLYVMTWKRGRSGSGWTVRRNGMTLTPSPIPDSSFPTGPFQAFLGSEYMAGSGSAGANLMLFELHVYPRELSAAETTALEQGLAATHGVGWWSDGPTTRPDDLLGSNLVAWYDATTLSATDGAPLSTWPNRASNVALTASGTAQPLFDADGLNGHPSVVGDGVDDSMLAMFNPAVPVGSRFSYWVVLQHVTPLQNTSYVYMGPGDASCLSLGSNGSNWLVVMRGNAGLSTASDSALFDTHAHILSTSLSADFQHQHLKLDGISDEGDLDPGASAQPTSEFRLFAANNNILHQDYAFANTRIGEVIVSRAQPTPEVDLAIQRYLAAKWRPAPPGCGNGVIDVGEECDDGNTSDKDYCRTNCTTSTNICSPNHLCANGEGVCTADIDCEAGLSCGLGMGSRFGYPPSAGVCWDPDACQPGLSCGDSSYCGTCCTPNCGTAGSDDGCHGICPACTSGVDSDHDGLSDCSEQNDDNPWTNPVASNGVTGRLGANCHASPSCALIDTIDEVNACSVSLETQALHSGWNFSTADDASCDPGFAFQNNWSVCRPNFAVRYDGLVAIDQAGTYCFGITGSTQSQCASAFVGPITQTIVTNGTPGCATLGAGLYPVRWFYETTNATSNSFQLKYCYAAQGTCAPSQPVTADMLRPPSTSTSDVCRNQTECTELCPCDVGGVCANSRNCRAGLQCRTGVGDRFGKPATTPVCWDPVCNDPSSPEFECGHEGDLCGPVCPNCSTAPNCAGKSCGPDGCSGSCGDTCGQGQAGCRSDRDCAQGLFCNDDNVCVPKDCRSLSASKNPCRNPLNQGQTTSCGICPQLAPNCDGKNCGPNGAGGTCGPTPSGAACINGQVVEFEPRPLPQNVTTNAVGAIPGSFSVSSDGKATYTVPISVPPGRGGLTPQIALRYSSGEGNGLMGVGWTIDGLSAITRCNKTIVTDGYAAAFTYANDDALCLNGTRLIPVSTVQGSEDIETTYHLERDDLSEIVGYATGLGPQYFRMTTSDGRILEFGGDATSRIQGGFAFVRTWALSKVNDRNGNYAEYKYDVIQSVLSFSTKNIREYYPSSIRYSLHPSDEHIQGYIAFAYDDTRDDALSMFRTGEETQINRRLSGVSIYGSGGIRQYTIGYEDPLPGAPQSRVHSITECAGRNILAAPTACKPPTTFTYERDGGLTPETQVFEQGDLTDARGDKVELVGDFDGDGKDDVLLTHRSSTNQTYWKLWITDPLSSDPNSYSHRVVTPAHAPTPPTGESEAALSRLYVIDYDNDGADDILDLTANQVLRFYDDDFHATNLGIGVADSRFVLDLDGDGRKDLLECILQEGTATWRIRLLNDNGFHGFIDVDASSHPMSFCPGPAQYAWRDSLLGWGFDAESQGGFGFKELIPEWYQVPTSQVLDVDGDGVQELLFLPDVFEGQVGQSYSPPPPERSMQYDVLSIRMGARNAAAGGDDVPSIEVHSTGIPWLAKQLDLNGDGLRDFFEMSDLDGIRARIRIWLNTGAGFIEQPSFDLPPELQYARVLYSADRHKVAYSLNPTSTVDPIYTATVANTVDLASALATPLDYDGDGREDILLPVPVGSQIGVPAQWSILRSTGNGLEPQPVRLSGNPSWNVLPFPPANSAANGETVHAYVSRYGSDEQPIVLDFTGDGLPDILKKTTNFNSNESDYLSTAGVYALADSQWTFMGRKGPSLARMRTIVNGLRQYTDIKYRDLADPTSALYGQRYSAEDCVYPQYCRTPRSAAVITHDVGGVDAQGNFVPKEHFGYFYRDGRVDLSGRGWLGFAEFTTTKTAATDPSPFEYTETTKLSFDNHTVDTASGMYPGLGTPIQILHTIDGSGTSYSKTTDQTSGVIRPSSKTLFTYAQVRHEIVREDGIAVRDLMTYATVDKYGNPSGVVMGVPTFVSNGYSVDAGDGHLFRTDVPEGLRILAMTYKWQDPDVADAYDVVGRRGLGDLVTETFVLTGAANPRPGELPLSTTRVKQLDYDDLGNLTRVTIEPQEFVSTDDVHSFTLQTDFTPDDFGNIINITQSSPILASRTSEVVYDSIGYLPVEVVDAKEHHSSVVIDPRYGQVTRTIDPNGAIFDTAYDDFGRVVLTVDPDGTTTTTDYQSLAANETPLLIETTRVGGIHQKTNYDWFGRPRKSSSTGFHDVDLFSDSTYDDLGRLRTQTIPSRANEVDSTYTTTMFEHDARGRVVRRSWTEIVDGEPTEVETTSCFDKLQSCTRDPRGFTHCKQTDTLGRITTTYDPQSVADVEHVRPDQLPQCNDVLLGLGQRFPSSAYRYGEFLESVSDGGGTTTIRPDRYGRKLILSDPDTGIDQFEWNGFGELTRQTNGNGEVSSFTYDPLGRMTRRRDIGLLGTGQDGDTHWYWDGEDPANPQLEAGEYIGALGLTVSPEGHRKRYSYDTLGQLSTVRLTMADTDEELVANFSLYSHGQPQMVSYGAGAEGNGLTIARDFDDHGNLYQVRNAALTGAQAVLWSLNQTNAYDQPHLEHFGNGTSTAYDYDTRGRTIRIADLASDNSTTTRELGLTRNLNGSVTSRTQSLFFGLVGITQTETFGYDQLDRITTVDGANYSKRTQYNSFGNIGLKDGQDYIYQWSNPASSISDVALDSFKSHAVSKVGGTDYTYDDAGRVLDRINMSNGTDEHYRSYNRLGKPTQMWRGNQDVIALAYDADGTRIRKTSGSDTTTYLEGLFERRSHANGSPTQEIYYISNGRRIVAQMTNTLGGSRQTSYLHPDHLGSPEVISTADPSQSLYQSYDVFGARRDPGDWGALMEVSGSTVTLGYTGHEAEESGFAIINMKGRQYDPRAGRFMAPDPFVQAPFSSQGLNRYSYVFNNPLNYVDPSGYGAVMIDQCTDCGSTNYAYQRWIDDTGEAGKQALDRVGSGLIGQLIDQYGGSNANTLDPQSVLQNDTVGTRLGFVANAGSFLKGFAGAGVESAVIGTVGVAVFGAPVVATLGLMGLAYGAYEAATNWDRVAGWTSRIATDTGDAQDYAIEGSVVMGVLGLGAGGLSAASAEEGVAVTVAAEEPMPSGWCFTAGTLVATYNGPIAIEDVRVGDRVLTKAEGCPSSTEVVPSTWLLIDLRMPNPDGSADVLDVELLRPRTWVAEHHVFEGASIAFGLEELGIAGHAHVTNVAPSVPIKDGPGRVVLMTVTHLNGEVLELRFENSATVLEPTATHQLFSANRDAWIPAGQLERGEQLITAHGTAAIASIRKKSGIHRVYNLEVEGEHSYFVSDLEVLGHNTCAAPGPNQPGYGPENSIGVHPASFGGDGLAKQLASEAQLAEMTAGQGEAIIGAGTTKKLGDASRLAAEYGGSPADWAKMSSSGHVAADGTAFQTHWYENVRTALQVEPKVTIDTFPWR